MRGAKPRSSCWSLKLASIQCPVTPIHISIVTRNQGSAFCRIDFHITMKSFTNDIHGEVVSKNARFVWVTQTSKARLTLEYNFSS